MNNPHINKIFYSLVTNDKLSFKNCPALIIEEETHKFILENDILTCELITHFPDIDSARELIEPFLRAWELDAALKNGSEYFNFVFKKAEIINSAPSPNNASIEIILQCPPLPNTRVSFHLTNPIFPNPPLGFSTNPDVETLWFRYKMYQEGKEPLLSMAYFCYSYLTYLSGNQKEASSTYFIKLDVLKKLSELTSTRGDKKTARKIKNHDFQPLTGQEQKWIEECVKKIIRRLGENITSSTSMITMADLPHI